MGSFLRRLAVFLPAVVLGLTFAVILRALLEEPVVVLLQV